jgi:hypothetical protein
MLALPAIGRQSPAPTQAVDIEGFTPDQVRAALGQPSLVDNNSRWISWYYDGPRGTAKVYFIQGKATRHTASAGASATR